MTHTVLPRLVPVIASYSGDSAGMIRAALDEVALATVARVALAPAARDSMDERTLAELIAMRVLREDVGLVQLTTAVFLEGDLERVTLTAREFGRDLAERVAPLASALPPAAPAVANFLIGILAIGQRLGHALREEGLEDDWAQPGGRYAQSKVDFDQECPAGYALGPDLQNKNLVRGECYAALYIGPEAGQTHKSDSSVDDLAAWLAGEHEGVNAGEPNSEWTDPRRYGLLRAGVLGAYLPAIEAIARTTETHYRAALPGLIDLLRDTASGRQGVPPSRMSMHLWRYLRRAVACELYARGVLTDAVPETGVIAVLYENGCEAIEALLR